MNLSNLTSKADSATNSVGDMDTSSVSSFLSNNDNVLIIIGVVLVLFIIFRKAFKFLALVGIIAAVVYFMQN